MKVALVLCLCMGHLTFGANPNYSYHIKIDDAAHANFQEKAESRKGPDAQGFYSVVEPNGALRTVQYTADDRGFNPIVTYSYGHQGASAAVYSNIGGVGAAYAPAFVSDKRVQIVDKFTGPPPQLNIQPFALPAPGGPGGPIVVPAPLRVAPAPQLIAEAQGVNYAPAYMPPVTAFVQPQRTYLPPPPQRIVQTVAAAPVQQVVYQQQGQFNGYGYGRVVQQPQPQQPFYHESQVVYQQAPQPALVQVQQPQRQVVYQAPRQVVVAPQPQQVVYEAPRPQPQVVAVKQTQVVFQAPKPAVVVVEKQAVKVATPVVSQVVDSYAVAPKNTVSDPNAPVYPDAVKPIRKPEAVYGPPDFASGQPLGLVETVAAPPPVKVVQQVKVAQPVQTVQYVQQQPIRVAQPVKYVQQPQVQYVQQQQYVAPAPAPVKVVQQQVAAAPVLGLYAGAVGYHTQNVAPDAYLHSYGTQGFQVTSSRKFNKNVLPVPLIQKQVVQQQVLSAPIVHQPQPQYYQPQVIQQTYAPQYLPPAPVRQVIAAPPAPIRVAAPVVQAAPLPVYGAPAVAKLAQPVAIAGKKQNPLTFAYSYDQGGAKVSHSYSGSGW